MAMAYGKFCRYRQNHTSTTSSSHEDIMTTLRTSFIPLDLAGGFVTLWNAVSFPSLEWGKDPAANDF